MSQIEKIVEYTGYSEKDIALIKSTVAKGTTDTELSYFINVCKSTELNPFLKQIWCYKDNKGNLIILAGRDGFLQIAQRNPRWNGIVSCEVCENDIFENDIPSGFVKHSIVAKNRGQIIGAYCLIKPKCVDIATIEWADIKIYDKNQYIWNTHKSEMIKKVAEIHALKKAFGISGIYGEEEFNIIEAKEVVTHKEISEVIELEKEKIQEFIKSKFKILTKEQKDILISKINE